MSDGVKGALPTVAIIVLSWNRIDEVLACLDCVERQDYSNARLIVVDNGSTDDSVTLIRARFPRAELIPAGSNYGYAGGVNLGLAAAGRLGVDFSWLLNDDVRVEADTLSLLVEHARVNPQIGLFSPLIALDATHRELQFAGAWVDWNRLVVRESRQKSVGPTWYADASRESVLTGAAMLVRMSVQRAIGSFDERFFAYYEDTDYSIRAVRAGFGTAVVSTAVVFHRSHRDADTRPPAFFYYMLRNELLFFRLHRPGGLGFRGLRRWWMTVLEWTGACHDRNQERQVDACVDGAWDALRRWHGPIAQSRRAPRWFRALVGTHPYLLLLMTQAKFGALLQRLFRRSEA